MMLPEGYVLQGQDSFSSKISIFSHDVKVLTNEH